MCALPDAQLINNLVPFPLGILKGDVDMKIARSK